jgi:CheY-like chemotaxis protein
MERFSALVLSHDANVLRVVNKALEAYGLEANVARSVRDANELLNQRRFDLAVCDYDLPGAQQLAYLAPGTAWRGMVFAVVRAGQLNQLDGQRVHMTLAKPLTVGLFAKGLKAAYSTMAHERRAAARYPIEVDTSWAEFVEQGGNRALPRARVLNLSRTGLRLQTAEMLPQHAIVRVSFQLPQAGLFCAAGEVMWAKASGKSGIRFTHVPDADRKRLEEWIGTRLPAEFSAALG